MNVYEQNEVVASRGSGEQRENFSLKENLLTDIKETHGENDDKSMARSMMSSVH